MTDVAAHLRRLARRWSTYWPDHDVAEIVADVEQRFHVACEAWELEGIALVPGGEVALTGAGTQAGRSVILKVNPRNIEGENALAGEAAALVFWRSTGIVPEVLGRRDGGSTFLMEQVLPGTPLEATLAGYDERLAVLGGLVARLHRAGSPPDTIVHMTEQVDYWRRALAGSPSELAEIEALLVPASDDVLVHADLHAGNALRDGETWKVIDPHANRADRHADVWALIDPLAPDLPGDSAAGQQEAWRRVVLYAMAAHLEPERAAMWARLWARAEALWIQALPDPADDDAWASRLHRFADALS